VKASGGIGHLAQDIVARLPGDTRMVGIASDRIGSEIAGDQERVVVEHLFEMRHEPALVDRIAMKTAAELIVNAAAGHLVECYCDDAEQVVVARAMPH